MKDKNLPGKVTGPPLFLASSNLRAAVASQMKRWDLIVVLEKGLNTD